MNATEWRKLSSEVGKGTDYGSSTDWFKETEQTGITNVQNISMSGGSDKSTYRASFNYRDAQGVQITTGYTQLNGRLNFTQKALNDKLTLDVNVGATKKNASYGFPAAFRYASIYNPTSPVTSTDAEYAKYDGYFQQVLFDYYNPVAMLKQNVNEGQDNLLNIAFKARYQLTKGLAIDAFYSLQSTDQIRGSYYAKHDLWTGMNRNGLASRSEANAQDQLFETTIHWTGDIAPGVNLTALGGYSYQDYFGR
jgi:iron complex outermembrane receptor protein